MPDKKIDEINRALNRISDPSIFDSFIREIDTNEIPPEYIERVTVYYDNGSVIDISRQDIVRPIPVDRDSIWDKIDKCYGKMTEIKIFVDTYKLETDVNASINKLFKNRC